MGSTGACPSEKQQLESIKIWPGQARPLASPALSLLAWLIFVLCTALLVMPSGLTLWKGNRRTVSSLPKSRQRARSCSWTHSFHKDEAGKERARGYALCMQNVQSDYDKRQRCSVGQSRRGVYCARRTCALDKCSGIFGVGREHATLIILAH